MNALIQKIATCGKSHGKKPLMKQEKARFGAKGMGKTAGSINERVVGRARLAGALLKLGMLKEAAEPKLPLRHRVKRGLRTAGKVGKWGGIGLGVYLALKALEGAHEAKQETAQRW